VTLFFSFYSVYPDLNLDYPFIGGDTYDWISNGLYFSGEDVRYSGRPPLFPLIMAALIKLDILSYFPVIIWAFVFAAGLIFYKLLILYVKHSVAFLVTLALWLNFSFQYQSLEIMADVLASCLLLFSAFFFIRAADRKWYYLLCGFFAGLSAVTQQTALLLPIPLIISVMLFRKGDFKIKEFWGGMAIFIFFPGSWYLYKYIQFQTPGDLMVRQWRALKFHLDGIGSYLFSGLSYFGIVGFILLVVGFMIWKKKAKKSLDHFFLSFLFLIILVFFVFFYDYSYKRFLVYIIWFAGIFIGCALFAIKKRAIFVVATVTLLVYSLIPLPIRGVAPTRIALWPAPLIYLKVKYRQLDRIRGRLDFSTLGFDIHPSKKLTSFNNFYRAWSASKNKKIGKRFDPDIFKEDRAAIYIFDQETERNNTFPTPLFLGNALRKKVKYLSSSFIFPYLEFLSLQEVMRLKNNIIYRLSPPELHGSWLLIRSAREYKGPKLDKPGILPDDIRTRFSAGLKKALKISEYIEDSDAIVYVFESADRDDFSFFYLPFVTKTTEFFIIEEARIKSAKKILKDLPFLDEKQIGSTNVKKLLISNRRSAAIVY
jgi:hypothetical protein